VILIIDNYDSFVFNVARYLVELDKKVEVARNDQIDTSGVAALQPEAIVVSPGPCGPREAGRSLGIIKAFNGRIPILGICLGHQCIGDAFGGTVDRACEPMHGRTSLVRHDGAGLFKGLPNPLSVGRYHSLIVRLRDDHEQLVVTARSEAGEIMGIAHRNAMTFGVQFHPESVLTMHGHAMLRNFLELGT
jgi:para-aminobenzoate synthetase component II